MARRKLTKRSMDGADGTRRRPPAAAARGRPPKFGRPSEVVALTLPRDVLSRLRAVHSDPGWAIVQLVESAIGGGHTAPQAQPEVATLVHLPGRRALIVVEPRAFRHLRGVSMIPLADGRAFLAFDQGAGLADLEVAITDRLEEGPKLSAERSQLMQMRTMVRSWRRSRGLVFRTKSIIVAEGAVNVGRRPLTSLHGAGKPVTARQ